MNLTGLKELFLSSDLPSLPNVALAQWSLAVSWALVLAAGLLWLGRGLTVTKRWGMAGLVMFWTLLSGVLAPAYSPAYWLGLAFQSPSLMSTLLCLLYVLRQTRLHPTGVPVRVEGSDGRLGGPWDAGLALIWVGVVWGWVLLLDLLAWWPVSLYALGFSPAALTALCALTAWFGLAWGRSASGQTATLVLAAVLVGFVLTRLPSGNVWDAVLDPWLWLTLQVYGLRQLWRRLRRVSA